MSGGQAVTSGQGSITQGNAQVSLKSRKVGGGTGTQALSGVASAGGTGLFTPTPLRTPTGQAIAPAQGAYVQQRVAALLGSSATSQTGTMTAPATAEADWIARSTASGVTFATDFRVASDVTNYRHIDGTEGNVTQDTTDKIPSTNGASLKITVPASAGTNPGSWRHPLNTAWSLDGDGFGHNEFYIQYRVKLGPRRCRPSNGSAGFKTSILSVYQFSSPNSTASAQPFEIVVNTEYGRRAHIYGYRQDGIGFAGWQTPDATSPGGLNLQPGVDWGAGSTSNQTRFAYYNAGGDPSAGTVLWEENVWITVLQRIKIAAYGGSTGNEYDMWVAWPGDTSYVQIFRQRDFTLGPTDAQFSGGYNGLWLLPYETGRINADYDTWHKYTQVIVSTLPIACPTPHEVTPAWFSSQTAKTWTAPVSNTVNSVYVLGDSGLPARGLFAFSSGVCHRNRGAFRHFGGGHTDNDVNSMFEVVMRATSPAWVRLTNPSSSAGGSVATGVYGDGQPRSSHSWHHLTDTPMQGTWIAPLPGTYNNGHDSGRYFRFDDAGNTWVAVGYEPGTSSTVESVDPISLGHTEYDPCTGLIYVSASVGPFWTIDPTSGTAIGKAVSNDTNYYTAGALSRCRRCFVIWKGGTIFRVYDIDNDVMHSPTLSGSGPADPPTSALVWHEASGAFLAWGDSGASLYKLTPPTLQTNTFTSAWTWSVVSADGGNTITPPASSQLMPTVKIIKDFGGLRTDLLVIHQGGETGSVYCYKLPRGGV